MTRSVCLGLVGVLTMLPPASVRAQLPEQLRSADALAARIEAAERSPALAAELDEFLESLDLPTVDAELAKISDYLSANPEDATALILSVRLGRVHDLLAFRDATMAAFDGQAAGLPEPPSYDRYQEILDRVLARDSTMAAAHYWKARLLLEETMRAAETAAAELGLVPDSAAVGTVAARVLQHAGAAVASDADDVAYREFYAALLVDDGRPEVAADVLSHPSTAGSLLHLLVQDLVTFAPPSGAEPDAVLQAFHYMTGMMGAANSEDPWLSAYLEARLQSWSTNASLADVEAHYRARWPDVRFFPVESWDGAVTAVIVPSPNGWHAVSDSSEFESGAEEEGDFVSLLLLPPPVVAEMAENARNQGVPDGIQRSGPRVGILYANWRRGPAGDEPALRPEVVPPAPQ